MQGSEPAAMLEISPLYATSAHQLKQRQPKLGPIAPGATVYVDERAPD
jgi:hypothetical protein